MLCVYYRLDPGPTYACHTCEWTVNNNGTRLVHHYLAYTVYGKTSMGKTFAVFHSIVNVVLLIMGFSIGSTSLQQCYSKILWCIDISHSKLESFAPQMFSHIWYVLMYICMYVFVHVHTSFMSLQLLCFLGPTDPWNIKI